jgi:hypothetical protein
LLTFNPLIVADNTTLAVPSNGTADAVTSPPIEKFRAVANFVAVPAFPVMLPFIGLSNVHVPLIVVAPILAAFHTGSVSVNTDDTFVHAGDPLALIANTCPVLPGASNEPCPLASPTIKLFCATASLLTFNPLIVADNTTLAVPSNGTADAVTSPPIEKFRAVANFVAVAAFPVMLPFIGLLNVHVPVTVSFCVKFP